MRNFATSARFRWTTRRDIKYSFGKQSRESRITKRCCCYPRCEKMGGVSLSELNWSKQKHTVSCWPLTGREKVPLVKIASIWKFLKCNLISGLVLQLDSSNVKVPEDFFSEIIVDFTTKLVDWLERGMLFFLHRPLFSLYITHVLKFLLQLDSFF